MPGLVNHHNYDELFSNALVEAGRIKESKIARGKL